MLAQPTSVFCPSIDGADFCGHIGFGTITSDGGFMRWCGVGVYKGGARGGNISYDFFILLHIVHKSLLMAYFSGNVL